MIFNLYGEIKEDYYEAKNSMELSDERYEELRKRFEKLRLEVSEPVSYTHLKKTCEGSNE